MSSFVHLRSHSNHSMTNGLMEPEDLIKTAKLHNMPAMAITESDGMFSAIKFYSAGLTHKVKPILGAELRVIPDVTQGEDADAVSLVMLAKNEEGYRQLMRLISRASVENSEATIPYIKQSWFQEAGLEDVIVLSGDGVNGELAKHQVLSEDDTSRAEMDKVVDFYNRCFPGRYFLEVQRFDQPFEDIQVAETVALSARSGVPVVATHPIQFAEREDYYYHELRTCASNGQLVNDPVRVSAYTREQYFKSPEEMQVLFADLPVALENAGHIATLCSNQVTLNVPRLPHFDTPNGETEEEHFATLAKEGLEKRLERLFPNKDEREAKRAEYESRLAMEIGVIQKMGFSGYFLIVADFIGWAKENNIPIGPGRGSGAGSLVAYSMGITNLDPLPNGLLFERFLNPDRVSMPDFDIDMDIFRRGEIIDYVRHKYGESSVSQITALGTLAPKKAIKNLGRALGYPFMATDTITKMFPGGIVDSMEAALNSSVRLKEKYDNDAAMRDLFDSVSKIEGCPDTVGTHAAGVLIAPGHVADFSPVSVTKDGQTISQYDKDDVEKAGLVKFDFLGLANLSIIQEAENLINRDLVKPGEPKFNIEDIPMNEAEVYKLFADGETIGIFQFESSGMQNALRQAKPDRFSDLVALTSLFRPGPIEFVDSYCKRKHGQEQVEYPDPRVEPILKETHGIMVYQEQVMQVAQALAGYTLAGADLLRRAMGKKKPEEMEKQRAIFTEGCGKNGIAPDKAEEIFDLIETFAGYGFNKSHAAAYSLVSYQTAYLKTFYPAQFYSASMNVAARQNKNDEIAKMAADARRRGIKLLPPDINESDVSFSPRGRNAVMYGLSGMKSVSLASAQAIIKARQEKGKFTSFFDFSRKLTRKEVGKKTLESLVVAGAFDNLERNRASLYASVAKALDHGADIIKAAAKAAKPKKLIPAKMSKKKKAEVEPSADLFGAPSPEATPAPIQETIQETTAIVDPILEEVVPWDGVTELEKERSAMGFYFSAHPFEIYLERLQGLRPVIALSELENLKSNKFEPRLLAGVLSGVKLKKTRNDTDMANVRLEDGMTSYEAVIFSRAIAESRELIKDGTFVVVEANVEDDNRGPDYPKSIKINHLHSAVDYEVKQLKEIHLALPKESMELFNTIAQKHHQADGQGAKVHLYVPINDTEYDHIKVDEKALSLKPSRDLMEALRERFGAANVKCVLKNTFDFTPRENKQAARPANRFGR